MVSAVTGLARTYTPNIFEAWQRLVLRFRRWQNPLPAVGSSAMFWVQERHWDEARIKCQTGNRSTHCVLAQAIAERFAFPSVSVGSGGDVTAYELPGQIMEDEFGPYVFQPGDPIYFQTDDRGASIISDFDYLPMLGVDPEIRKPAEFPIAVWMTRIARDD
jgi:hypothetical protein